MSLELSRRSKGCDDSQEAAVARISSTDSHEPSRHTIASYSACEDSLPDMLMDVDDQCIVGEATVMDAKEITIEAPAVPEKSALRRSRLLNSLKIDTTKAMADPHDLYLSSEEDASSSADDFSDYDYDSNSDESEESSLRRRSQEVTARAVSVIFVGRPCVVDLASGRRSVSPIRRPRSQSRSQSRSRSSSPSIRRSSSMNRESHPPRQTSLLSTIDMPKESPSFLSQDPFATSSYNYKLESTMKDAAPAGSSPRAPKTTLHRFQKSLSLVRKRSRPNLKDAASRDSLGLELAPAPTANFHALSTPRTSEEEQPREPEPVPASAVPESPVTFNDIMMSARKNTVPNVLTKQPPPLSPTLGRRGLLGGLNMNRRRSIRIKP
ncbi:hypothetical protein AAE478_004925 [Parahypoxylon ruwenzoriense]